MKSFFLTIVFAMFATATFGQVSDKSNNYRYPNELKGFNVLEISRLKGLVPGVSTEAEAKEAGKFFMDECKKPYHEDVDACQLDINWDASFTFSEDGKLHGIYFYPRKRIPFSKVKFSKKFMKGGMGIVHSINAEKFISYSDEFGLRYVIVDESGDSKYRKGDLFYIEYGISERE
ncbi:MAG: hypothetical protein ACR2M8_12550 [Pyrinomonadaceae bacterium]|nr:hypothetical protein [Acidobacteriota bacterium]